MPSPQETGGLAAAEHIENTGAGQSDTTSLIKKDVSGRLNKYIPNDVPQNTENTEKPVKFRMTRNTVAQSVYGNEPLMVMAADDHGITYTSNLDQEVVNVVFLLSIILTPKQ